MHQNLPALSVATLFGFLVAWNEFVLALTVTKTPAAQTMPVGIASLITQFQTYWGQMMAVASVYLVPVLVLTVITQRGDRRWAGLRSNKGLKAVKPTSDFNKEHPWAKLTFVSAASAKPKAIP